MPTNSPVGKLIEVLQDVKKSARLYETTLWKNEAMTRAVLIDPVLRAMGWSIENPAMVEVERKYRDVKLDYALLHPDKKSALIVEAKALGTNLGDIRILNKILTYAITCKIPTVFLTNGLIWKHFRLEQLQNIDPTTLDLTKNSLATSALYLINNLDATLYWEEPKSDPVPPVPPPPAKEAFIPLSELESDQTGKDAPKYLRLPDGTVKELKYWRDLLFETLCFLVANQPHLTLPLPDVSSKTIHLIDIQPPDRDVAYEMGSYQDRVVYFYLNYSASRIVANTRHALDQLPREARKVEAAVAFEEDQE